MTAPDTVTPDLSRSGCFGLGATPEQAREIERLGEYLSSGADHVAIPVAGGPDKVLPTLSELAGPLGLSH